MLPLYTITTDLKDMVKRQTSSFSFFFKWTVNDCLKSRAHGPHQTLALADLHCSHLPMLLVCRLPALSFVFSNWKAAPLGWDQVTDLAVSLSSKSFCQQYHHQQTAVGLFHWDQLFLSFSTVLFPSFCYNLTLASSRRKSPNLIPELSFLKCFLAVFSIILPSRSRMLPVVYALL